MRRTLWSAAVVLWAASALSAQAADGTLRLTGSVVDYGGAPAAQATVIIETSDRNEPFRAACNANGRFAIDLPRHFSFKRFDVELPPDSPLKLWRIDPPAMPGDIGHGRASAEVRLMLRGATCVVSGKVRAEGGPVEGAKVALLRLWWFDGGPDCVQMETLTDAGGAYRFDGLLPGFYSFASVEPPEGSELAAERFGTSYPYPGFHPTRVKEDKETTRDFRLSPARPKTGLRIIGRVIDESGRPVVGAKVRGFRAPAARKDLNRGNSYVPPNVYDETVTDADGRYVLRGLVSETYAVDATPPEGSDLAPSNPMIGIDVAADRELDDIVLVQGGTLDGVVTGPDGRPVAGAVLSLRLQMASLWAYSQTTIRLVTDPAGRYRFACLGTGRYELRVEPPVGSEWIPRTQQGIVALAKIGRRLDVSLFENCDVEGRITDEQGHPVAGVEVTYQSQRMAVSDDEGRYRVEGVRGQRHELGELTDVVTLAFTPPAKADVLPMVANVWPTVGKALPYDVTLKTGGTIGGQVLDADGKPVAFARITVYSPTDWGEPGRYYARTNDPQGWVITDALGRFSVRGVPLEPLDVCATPPAESNLARDIKTSVRAEAGGVQLLKLTLPRGAVVTGVVRDKEGNPVRDMLVRITGRSFRYRLTATDASGRYRFEGLPAGEMSIIVLPQPAGAAAVAVMSDLGKVETAPGETVEVDLTLSHAP